MIEKSCHLNVKATHVKGNSQKVADYFSRNPLPGTDGEEFQMRTPVISDRSKRVISNGVDLKDPLVGELAREGAKDEKYVSPVIFTIR